MPEVFWQKIGEVEALTLNPDGVGCVEGKLIIWKLSESGVHGGLYAVGRSKETAIVTRSWDWNSVQALIDADQEQEMRWREHTGRLSK